MNKNLFRYQYVENWTEADLALLPPQESGQLEYKSSLTKDDDLGNKISVAASAFWNSGGGIFVAGVNEKTGKIDGGITASVGRQKRRDWVDQQINKTQPLGKYWVNLIPLDPNSPLINPNHIVLVIGFEESTVVPHMAYNNRYYIRTGVHSDSASHFLVEALRARRVVQTPIMRALLRPSKHKPDVIELEIAVLNESVALNAIVLFRPLPKVLAEYFSDRFPLHIPVIDRQHSFSLDLYAWGLRPEMFGEEPIEMQVTYEDFLGRTFEFNQTIDVRNSIAPMLLENTELEALEKSLAGIVQQLSQLNQTFKARFEASLHRPNLET
jgi:hypothetical protein